MTIGEPKPLEYQRLSDTGWKCPSCGQVWAPWVMKCDCKVNNGWTLPQPIWCSDLPTYTVNVTVES